MKRTFLLSLFGLLIVTGCSEQSPKNETEYTPDESAATNYVSISLVAAGNAGTRAGLEDDYVDGRENENSVKSVRFFFFDAGGNAAAAWKKKGSGGYESFLDWYPTAEDFGPGDPEQTVEKIVNATLGVNTPSSMAYPELVLAVVNPTPGVLSSGSTTTGVDGIEVTGPSLEELRAVVADFKTGLTGMEGEDGFVMSNSVYVRDGSIMDATPLGEENFAMTIELAQENPVVVFVERVLARVDMSISSQLPHETLDDGTVIYKTATTPYVVNGEEQDIYVRFLGWNVTGTPDNSRLVKKVSATWANDIFGNTEPWNSADFRRSFWAVNPAADDFDYQFGTFAGPADGEKNFNPAGAAAMPAANETATVYLPENAAVSADVTTTEYPSKVILAAQLVDAAGEPFLLAEWEYKKYTLQSLKLLFANDVLGNLHKRTTAGGVTTFEKITPDDLDFATATQLYGDDDPDDSARYYVYAVLAEDAEAYTWTLGKEEDSPVYSTAQVNTYIRDRVNHVMVWNNGYAYYYFDIRHLGAEGRPGYFGVVRNHIYFANITKLAGLGTPVYDPDNEVIYPEKPEYDESIISAEVKILQWRIVKQEYELEWR